MLTFGNCRGAEVDFSSLFQIKQRDADKVDLWLTNTFLLPLTVMNVSLPQRLQGLMKVRTTFYLDIAFLIKVILLLIDAKGNLNLPCCHKNQLLPGFLLKSLLPPVCQVVNFSGPLTLPQGCWRVLSLQQLSRTLPVNQLFTLSLDTSLGTALNIPMYFHSTPFKVNGRLRWLVCFVGVMDLYTGEMC